MELDYFMYSKKMALFILKMIKKKLLSKTIILKNDDGSPLERYFSQAFLIKINNSIYSNKQFLISISTYLGNFELYDLEDENLLVSKLPVLNFAEHYIQTFRDSIIELPNNEYLYTFIGQKTEKDFSLYLQQYSFFGPEINNQNKNDKCSIKTIEKNNIWFARMVSSFILDTNIIVLFYYDNNRYIKIELLDENLSFLTSKNLEYADIFDDKIGLFFKCIHFFDNIGIFAYYASEQYSYPKILLENIDSYSINDLFQINLNDIIKEENQFNTQPLLNDLIINDNRFSLISSSKDKLVLYIILFDLYNNQQNFKIRLNKIDNYNLYNYKIFSDLSSIMFNNYLALSISVCNSLICENEFDDTYYCFLVI